MTTRFLRGLRRHGPTMRSGGAGHDGALDPSRGVLAADPTTAGRRAFGAVLLREDVAADRAALAALRAQPDIAVLDHRGSLLAESEELRPPLSAADRAEVPRWAWYPWRRALVSVLGPQSYRRVRLDRNRNKITAAEQQVFSGLTIGVVGLSVGHSIAHTLALEGLCGTLRLADNDSIELSNLNRIPASLFDVGVNKAIAVGRRIAELDPYLDIDVFTDGLTEECIDEFFAGVDLVVEECDSLDMKLRVREEARSRGIPVLMETSDRGLFDVERFDTEPCRELFHGLLGGVDPQSLRGLSTHDKAPHVMRILQTRDLSARMAASMVEIDRTVSTWPQLGGDVQLGGATVAAAVRRFGRGEPLASGRVRIDIDTVLDRLGEPDQGADGGAAPAAPEIDLTREVPAAVQDAVVHAIRLAPSGGNSQPWAVEPIADGVLIRLVRERTSAMDVGFRGSYVGIGAAVHNARIAAARHGAVATVELFPAGQQSDLVAAISLTPGSEPALGALYPAMVDRISNRNFGTPRAFGDAVTAELTEDVTAAGARLHLITDRAQVAVVADILAESDRVRYLTPLLHGQMMSELRWPGPERAAMGIDVHSLGLDASDLAKLEVAARGDVMRQLAGWGVGEALGDGTRDRVNASSAVAVVTVTGDSPTDYVRGGMAMEQFWIRTGQHDLGVQPVSPVFLYARSEADHRGLSADFSSQLESLNERFTRACGLAPDEVAVLVLRISHDAPPPAVRSQRLDRDDVMSPADGRRGR